MTRDAAKHGRQGKARTWILRSLASAAVLLASNAQAVDTAGSDDPATSSIVAIRSEYGTTLTAGQAVAIDNPYGDVSARFGGFEHQVQVYAILQEPAGATHIELEPNADHDGRYAISPRLPTGASIAEGQRVDLEVFVPEGHALSVRTDQGSIEVKGVHGDVVLASTAGNINLRGIKGAIQAETGGGQIDASLDTAPRRSSQRLATRTGDINVAIDDRLNAELDMATSALFSTEYSLIVTRRPGEEPNKHAKAVIGEDESRLILDSKRGQIRLSRRTSFSSTGDASAVAGKEQDEEQDDNDGD